MNLLQELRSAFEPALLALGADPAKVSDYLGMVKSSNDAKNGDYQANFAMPLAKLLGKKPQELAADVVAMLPTDELIESAAVAGPGFINVKLKDSWLADQVSKLAEDSRLGVANATHPKRYVIDYSGPNVAKPLHVGHLRSTIIGDALVRVLRFLGHTVVGDNHLGDWGTQFGILLYGYKNHLNLAAYTDNPVRELARLYVHVRQLSKANIDNPDDEGTGDIMEACRGETAKLHAGDPANTELWKEFIPHCLKEIHAVYDRLNLLPFDNILGESFYQSMLANLVANLKEKGIAAESNGATVVPNARGIIPRTPDELAKEEPPQLVQKRDGAFTYTTTDLATIKYRVENFQPDVLLYVVDARQALHFRTLFANAKRWGYDKPQYHHLQFGSVMGPDGKPFGARKGGAPELSDMIEEAKKRALAKYEASNAERKSFGHDVPELNNEFKNEIANAVGVGAIKYADLSGNRMSDYTFDYDKMLATEGNTATYIQYAYTRCRGILRKSGTKADMAVSVLLTHPMERALALQLLKFENMLDEVVNKYEPHHIASYLWELAKAFSGFFENCKVVDEAKSPELTASRLLLTRLVGDTIRLALGLLGIAVVERM
jgi:arginyl-tRNA synthetase